MEYNTVQGNTQMITKRKFKEEVKRIVNQLIKEYHPEKVILFGSLSEKNKSPRDIDLFIIGEMEEDQVFQAAQKVEETIAREINYHIATREEFLEKIKTSYFHKNIAKNVMLLIGNEDEFRRIIK